MRLKLIKVEKQNGRNDFLENLRNIIIKMLQKNKTISN